MHKQTLFVSFGMIGMALIATYATRHLPQATLIAMQEKVTICHIPNNKTMELPLPALAEHMAHGDYLGMCTENGSSSSSPPSEEQPTVTSDKDMAPTIPYSLGVHRGRGLGEHAAVIHRVFQTYGLHKDAPYQFTVHHENIRPAAFASAENSARWTLQLHAACCSMFRYLNRLRETRPHLRPGYIDWITGQIAQAVGEDPTEIKAALLGFVHEHPFASGFTRSLTQSGCLANPYVLGEGLVTSTPPLSHIYIDPLQRSPFTIQPHNSTGSEITFTIMNGDQILTNYGINHTKEMHLLVVRDDLRHFHHLHPDRDPNGTWHIPFTPPAGGTYWIYADFVGYDGIGHILRFERTHQGDAGDYGIQKILEKTKKMGELFVTLKSEPYPHGALFTYSIQDAYGNIPEVQEYLGAMGHGILLSPEGDIVHTHPSPVGDTLMFHLPIPTHDFYRIFTQFQIADEIRTVEFDWEPSTPE